LINFKSYAKLYGSSIVEEGEKYMLSVVIPVFNEEESLEAFYKELASVVSDLDKDYEIIFVDDGSKDKSLDILKGFHAQNKNVKIFSFRRNQGKSEALTYGFEKSSGDYIVTLDADLQDKPSEIAKLLSKVKKEGFSLVCGWRKNRKDSLPKIIASRIFNSFASSFWGVKLHDYNCGLKVYDRDAAKSLKLYGGLHRFIPLLVFQQGFAVTEILVEHEVRKFGKSKYGFSKLWKDLPDIFTMLFLNKYGKRPLHFFGPVGFIFLLIGFGILIYLTVEKIFYGQGIGNRPIIFLGMLLVLGGFQVLFTGFLADLIINSSHKQNKEFFLKYSTE